MRQRGFTMLEVLIAIMVISIGLLGLAALQMHSLRQGQSAYYRSVATQLAYDMSDRMRGNITGVLANAYNRTGIGTDYGTAVANCTTTAGCVAADLARNDAYEWQQLVQTLLPGGEGIICIDAVPNDGTSGAAHGCDGATPVNPNERPLHAIKIWWTDDRSEAATGKQLFMYSFRL
ncbi:MAG TPA: type IV pilus modification protein PilV [Burkholderiales bacterium]|nr:type IV pilus modification protein PilV [Burkholderiales bacterium]